MVQMVRMGLMIPPAQRAAPSKVNLAAEKPIWRVAKKAATVKVEKILNLNLSLSRTEKMTMSLKSLKSRNPSHFPMMMSRNRGAERVGISILPSAMY